MMNPGLATQLTNLKQYGRGSPTLEGSMTETLLLVKRHNNLGELVANIPCHPKELCQTPPLVDSLGTLRRKIEVVLC